MPFPTRLGKEQISATLTSRFSAFKDEFNWVISRLDFVENLADIDVLYQYDANGNVTEMTMVDAANPNQVHLRVQYTYNPDGTVQQEIIERDGVRVVRTYEYNEAGDVLRIQQRKQS